MGFPFFSSWVRSKKRFLFFLLLFLLFFFLLLFLFLFFLFLLNTCGRSFSSLILIVGRFGVSGFLAWALSEPLGQLGLGPLLPFIVLLLPEGLELFGPYHFPATFVQLPPVFVRPCVGSAFVFGVHADLWGVFSGEGLRVQSLLHGLLSELLLLSLLELFEIVVLPLLPLFEVILFSLETDNGVPQFGGFAAELVAVHGVQVQRFDADGQGDFLLLLQLFLGLGHLATGVLNVANTAVGFFGSALGALAGGLLLLLLSLHHGLPFLFSLLQPLPLLLGFLGLLVGLFLA